jgi:tRNA(fMet)-specific endonuclease VapC
MKYYLDTNILIHLLREKQGAGQNVWNIMSTHSKGDIKVPSMVKAELIFGAYKSDKTESTLDEAKSLLSFFEIVPFDDNAATIHGRLKTDMIKKGNMIGPNDLVIAATVLSRGGVLVTNNVREFKRAEGLQIEDWINQRGD